VHTNNNRLSLHSGFWGPMKCSKANST
jgi:hypothetical protein